MKDEDRARLDAKSLVSLRSMLVTLYDIGVRRHRPLVVKAIERGDLSLVEGRMNELREYAGYRECVRMAYVIYRGRKYGPFSVDDSPDTGHSTVQINAFLDLVESIEEENHHGD